MMTGLGHGQGRLGEEGGLEGQTHLADTLEERWQGSPPPHIVRIFHFCLDKLIISLAKNNSSSLCQAQGSKSYFIVKQTKILLVLGILI